MRALLAAIVLVFPVVIAGCGGDPPARKGLPEGFDVCETPLDGSEGPNGFDYLVQIDVGRTEEGEEEEWWEEEEEGSPFELDQPYSAATGHGYVGNPGEAIQDPGWTTWAWPYGGRGDDRIHLATRTGMEGYRFDLQDGIYAVTWHFIEKPEHWSGFREADLRVMGEIAVAGFDVFEEVGNRFMVTARALAKVEEGRLDLEFDSTGTQAPAVLSALEVEAIDPNTSPPADVTDLTARSGYHQAILTWEFGGDIDLRGANVFRSAGPDGPWVRINRRVVTARHYVDHGLLPGTGGHYYKVVAQDLFCNEAAGVVAGPVMPRWHHESELRVFDIRVSEAGLVDLTKDVSLDLYVPATLYIDGQAFPIEIRNRGASTRYLSKPNFKIRIKDDLEYQGRNGFKLNSEVVDPMLITEKLSYDLFNMSDALAPAASYVHLVLAGRYMGVYTEIEEVDSRFFGNHGIDPDGALYRLGGGTLDILESDGAYEEIYEKKTNESDPAGHANLIDFIWQLNRTPEHEFAGWWDQRFAADEYIDFLAVNTIVANHDMIDGNQYVYHDTVLDQWHHVPWDYNNGTFDWVEVSPLTLTVYDAGLYSPWWFSSITRWYANAELRARVLGRLDELIGGQLDADAVIALAEDDVSQAAQDVLLDPWMVAWERDQGYVSDVVPAIGEFVQARHGYLSEAVGALATLHGPLVINEHQALNTGQAVDDHGDEDPWIELYNRGEEAVALGNVCIGPDLRDPDGLQCFESDEEVAPGEVLLLWADGEPEEGPEHLWFTLGEAGGEIGLFQLPEGEWNDDNQGQILDLAFYGEQVAGQSYGRLENGSEEWGEILSPTPGD
jgi:spore coat protein H